jgi:KaiC/GvpD/RAD55 family RecA-like ATPase
VARELKKYIPPVELVILAQLLFYNPSYIDIVDLKKSEFSTENSRKLFSAFEKCNRRDGKIDIMEIANLTGFDVASILGLDEGVHKFTKENFINHVRMLKQKKIEKEFFKEAEKQRNLFLKGIQTDLTKIRELHDEITGLQDKEPECQQSESFKELVEREIASRDLIVDPLLAKREIVLLQAIPKIGKSVMSLNIAMQAAKGKPWLGFKIPEKRRALIFQIEVSEAALKKRISMMAAVEKDQEFLESILHYSREQILITTRQGFEKISRIISESNPDIIIFDSMLDFHDKDENSAREMRPVMDQYRRIAIDHNAAVLIIHHYGKDTEGRQGGYLGRGSSAIPAAADASWQMERLQRERYEWHDEEQYYRTTEISFESRYCQFFSPMILEMDPHFWFRPSGIECTSKIDHRMIIDLVKKAGGSIPRADLEREFRDLKKCGASSFVKSLEEAFERNLIDIADIEGARGGAKIVFIPEKVPREGGKLD